MILGNGADGYKMGKKINDLVQEFPKGLFNWYKFKVDGMMLYVGQEDSYAIALKEKFPLLQCVTPVQLMEDKWQEKFDSYFDYIVCVEILEKELKPVRFFRIIRKSLKQDGIFLLGMNNRIGLRYFCGDRDPYTCRSFDGIENYRRAYAKKEDTFKGRMYSKNELRRMLFEAGWEKCKFYSVLTDLKNPFLIYSEEYIPKEDLTSRVFPTYNTPDTVFLEEEAIYQDLIDNDMFHHMANAYLIECSIDGNLSDISQVTCSIERGRESAFFTIIHKDTIVEKRAIYPEGKKRIEELEKYGNELKQRGIQVVDAKIVNGTYVMPYVDAENGNVYLQKLLKKDKKKFLNKLDHFRDLILQSSEVLECSKDVSKGPVLQKGYPDMIPLNCFYVDGKFVFYDQEFCMENCPANLIIYRAIATLYKNVEFQKLIPINTLFERYGLLKDLSQWKKMANIFWGELVNRDKLKIYHEMCRRNLEVVNTNRQRMNYSEEEYQRLFVDIFKDIHNRKLILFGSGFFAERFIGMYGKTYPVYAVVDNNKERWGQFLGNIEIESPDIIKKLSEGEYKVIVCIKNYISVIKQLDSMGVKNYSIFDSGKSYPLRQSMIIDSHRTSAPKKYHKGYVAGVFDMFHVGHVNLLRKAREQCDYLIVGVVSDEGTYRQKGKYPVIPCEDRVEIVRSCKYVDQADELPVEYGGIRDAYKMYQFDCMFSGDDHEDNMGWKATKEYLKKSGADIVYFDYTKKVSSTILRQQLKDK